MNGLNIERTRKLLQQFNFTNLFIEELGWNRYREHMPLEVEGSPFALAAVAEKRGLVVFLCTTTSDESFPPYALRRKIERQIAKARHEHLIIYVDQAQTRQVWQWVKREAGRPDACREHEFRKGQSGEALIQKLAKLVVTLDEEESISIVDMAGRTRAAFDVEKITKKFYELFKKEHTAFLKFVQGISDMGDRQWYASIMLNRLMFVYFIQKKGFLDNDLDYLRNRLQKMQKEKGEGRFYSFYRQFLLRLFHEGLGKKKIDRDPDLERMLGKVPYLNGGLFDVHQLEHDYNDIQISDDAFDRLFAFFEQYHWHLDERPLRHDNEINPDVLGYIFEKYINQKQMGAYYTKEDITEYIGKNTIIPYLFDAASRKCKVAFEGEQSVWKHLQKDPDRYIYEAVRKGCELPLPPEIEVGRDTTKPDLLNRRKDWSRPAPATHALPTEIWREVVARRQRYAEVREKLAAGAVRSINDCITYNLDIRQFAQDVIENCDGPELLRAFWRAIVGRIPKNANEKAELGITILDPTCGSGAFLFAALNILEPLYEACLERMQVFVAELAQSNEKQHPEKFSDFKAELARVSVHPNQSYFIMKSIILNNLYGVDIMAEAVEICKLRLFLKMVAQVERDDQIEPLPDIDFNIRCGNTLIGFSTYAEVKTAVTTSKGATFLPGMDAGRMAKIEKKAQDLQQAFNIFRCRQVEGDGSIPPADKMMVRERLAGLENELNMALASKYGINAEKNKDTYEKWINSHHSFHWFIEYYGIMANGGFDVIIGNPPYVEIPKELNRSLLVSTYKSALSIWSRDEDVYTLVVERSMRLLQIKNGKFGMILPLSISFSTKRPFEILRTELQKEEGVWFWAHFDRIPSALFSNEVRTRCTIAILSRSFDKQRNYSATTTILRWNAEYREHLFNIIKFACINLDISKGIPKVSSQIQANALKEIIESNSPLIIDLTRSIPFNNLAELAPNFPTPCLYVGGTAYNWFPAWRDIPETTNLDGRPSLPARTAGYIFDTEEDANIVFSLLCSSMGYWWWIVASDAFNLKKWLLTRFPLSIGSVPEKHRNHLARLGQNLRTSLKKNYVYKDNKGRIGNFFLPACEREISEIDEFLAKNVTGLSPEFMEDICNFNSSFSRAEKEDDVLDV